MKRLVMSVTSVLLVCSTGAARESRGLSFVQRPVGLCGKIASWQSLILGLSAKEADCLDSISPLDVIEEDGNLNRMAHEIVLSQEDLVSRLKKSRHQCLSEVEFRLPEKVVFNREMTLTQELIMPWLEHQLRAQFNDKTYELIRFQIPKVDCSKVSRLSWGSFRIEGKNQLRLLLVVDEKNYALNGEIRFFQQVPVAVRQLMANEKIEARDLELHKKDVTFAPGYIAKIEDLVGRTASYPILAGEPIQGRQLKEEKLVEKGQIVQMQFKGENFLLSATGVAEQNGTLGDLVKIKNTESQKVISAVVQGKGLVEVQ